VTGIKLYSDKDCRQRISTSTSGITFNDSDHYSDWGPDKALKSPDSSNAWGGREDGNGNFWLDVTFPSPKFVQCIEVKNHNNNAAREIRIQAKNAETNNCEGIFTAKNMNVGSYATSKKAFNFDEISYHPWNKCKDTYQCKNGEFVEQYGISPCPPGEIFDVARGQCMNENSVTNCPLDCIPPTRSESWRFFSTRDHLTDTGKEGAWDVRGLKMYSDTDCNERISASSSGTTTNDSGHHGNLDQDNALKTPDSSNVWGGRANRAPKEFWMGVTFRTPTAIRCIQVQNADNNSARQVWVQALNKKTNEWEDVFSGKYLNEGKSAVNEIAY